MYLIQTVQTSWRPQLPLPKEVRISDEQLDEPNKSATSTTTTDMERLHQHASSSAAHKHKDNSLNGSQLSNSASGVPNKKWSFGRLFRKKKDVETESSSEDDRKAGFVPPQKYTQASSSNSGNSKPKSKSKNNRSSKLIGAGFDHIVVNPESRHHQVSAAPLPQQQQQQPQQPHIDNEFFLPVETIHPHEPYYQNQPLPTSQQQQQQQQYLQHPPQQYSRSSNSLDRRGAATRAAHKTRSAQRLPHEQGSSGAGGGGNNVAHFSSGEEELISLNSSTFSKYRSDESIHSGGQGGQNGGQSRRSRAARNERYYKRLSRDGEVSHGQVPVMYAPQPALRWKTQPVPLSIYNGPPLPLPHAKTHVRNHSQQMLPTTSNQATSQRLRNTSSLQNVAPYVQWGQVQKQQQQQQQYQQQHQQQQQQQQPKNLQNSVNDSKRSISYDSHIHLQNVNGRRQSKPLPPPPPPRDPLRRVNVSAHNLQNGSSGDLRPLSYAFDQNGAPALPLGGGLNGRCVSDDKIWAAQAPLYQSVHSLNLPVAQPTQNPHNRRFITRAERDAHPAKKSLPNGLDFHYIADATPRSRKPIHMIEPAQGEPEPSEPASSGILRTTKSGLPSPASKVNASDFWKRLDEGSQRRGRDVERSNVEPVAKPRSVSTSRAGELRSYPIPMYSEVYKPNRKPKVADEVDSVVCGSLHIKPSQENSSNNYVEIRHKDVNKTNSMPNHYQRRSGELPTTPNKYEEYVAEKREQHHKPVFNPPTPPQRKPSLTTAAQEAPFYFPRKKPANLEEAINELEAIYKSLGLTEEPEKKERVPTPSEFEKFALAHADEYEDEDSPAGEPDVVRDDVAYRNIQLANLQHKTAEKQPPFGIPIGPIVPSPQSDYLHVTPNMEGKKMINSPDIIKDDLAVRALRKDPPGPKERFMYPTGSLQKKNRATRTQSANIYSLIQRDAAKPAGGDLFSYMELTRSIDRSGSMSDLHKDANTAADVPATLTLLRNLKEQEQQQNAMKRAQIPFRHPSQGGAICQLPDKLVTPSKEEVQRTPVPLPRKSLTPEPTNANHQMEDALNQIAKDAQESSVKLSQELQELRKEALITASRPKNNPDEDKLEKELQEIEAVSEAAKRCGKMLLDTLPDVHEDTAAVKPRKLHKEGKLIKAIDQVSEAANAVCEKILKDIVTTEPPVVVQEPVKVKNKPKLPPLIMPNLIKKLDPLQSPQIEAIANRCMRQLSEMADENPDYDNLTNPDSHAAPAFCNTTDSVHARPTLDTVISTVAEVTRPAPPIKQQIEEIDMIMQECEAQVRSEGNAGVEAPTKSETTITPILVSSTDDKTTAPSMTTSSSSSNAAGPACSAAAPNENTTASSFSSSSDCLAKSSSSSARRRQSSSITSFNPYSSSDYIKSPSSEYHAPSTDPIKTFSTTSYDLTSSNATPNITNTNSTFSYSPSTSPPPLNLTPVSGRAAVVGEAVGTSRNSAERSARSSSPSQYNSSEELAMIFGIEEKPRRKSNPKPNVSGKVGANTTTTTTTTTIHASSNSSKKNHASFAKPDSASAQLTNPKTACVLIEQATNPACLNVIINDDDVDATTTITTTSTTTTNTNNTNTNSPTNASPSSCKLETIPELLVEQEPTMDDVTVESLKLSPNFNKLYASEISIIVDRALEDDMLGSATAANLTQFDSLSSLEETSSNPDSGNVSLADFPLTSGGGSNNACLQLQTVYNSRFKLRNTFVNEVSLALDSAKTVTEIEEDSLKNSEFPRLPTEEELLDSVREEKIEELRETLDVTKPNETKIDLELTAARTDSELVDYSDSISEEYASLCRDLDLETDELNESTALNDAAIAAFNTPVRKRSVVFETPQLNMSLSEVRVNYELNIETLATTSLEAATLAGNVAAAEAEIQPNVLSQITQCAEELDRLNAALDQMPATRRRTCRRVDAGAEVPLEELLPWQPTPRQRDAPPPPPRDDDDEKPSSSGGGVVSLLGELRPANSLTTLEHVIVACSLGVISGNDLFTILLLIIGVITILAIVLF